MPPIIKRYPTLHSTNSEALSLGDDAPHGFVVWAVEQTAGRGQRGNTWEAAPGCNATFSLVLRPGDFPPARQFELSMAVSLAITSVLDELLAGAGKHSCVKWPNDIYVDDRKICGILIENSITPSRISRMVVGVGLNINQTLFVSDAPNPVSLAMLTGLPCDVGEVVERVSSQILTMVEGYVSSPLPDDIHARYMRSLWRNDGSMHTWRDAADGSLFRAAVADVGVDGMLTLAADDGRRRSFAFKEVAAVL